MQNTNRTRALQTSFGRLDEILLTRIASAVPIVLFAIALCVASFAVIRYLDATEETDIRQTDRFYLTRLNVELREPYRAYRHHRVYPEPAARWVLEERELMELQQWIKRHDLVIQAALSRESASEERGSVKNWLH
jgi:hypothetical protein